MSYYNKGVQTIFEHLVFIKISRFEIHLKVSNFSAKKDENCFYLETLKIILMYANALVYLSSYFEEP